MPTFEVIHPGVLTTVQDLGRHGYQKYGLAVSGSSDHYAHRMANILVSNSPEVAVLEITLMGLKLKVLKTTVIAITGGDLQPKMNGLSIPLCTSIKVSEGDIIHFSGTKTGCRAYFAVAGGIDVPLVLGSRSTDTVGKIGGFNGRNMVKGDFIKVHKVTLTKMDFLKSRLHPDLIPEYPNHLDIRVILGPQDQAFTAEGLKTFFSSTYTVSKELDRMGCRLEGPQIEHKDGADIISEGIFMGAIQVPKNGLPIVFLVGRPSVGGYTKIGGVISIDMPKLAQVKPGNTIRFHQIDVHEAQSLYRESEKEFMQLMTHVKFN